MPRMGRLDLGGAAQHVMQRGNDRQPCFFREVDYLRYLQDLHEGAIKHGCRVHAYVLMTNHVHLLVTPSSAGAVGRMMQSLGRRYVRYVNDSIGRTGTLWEGRYKSSLVDSERYVMACYRYIELNPVRAAIVSATADYRWSSFTANGVGGADPLVSAHEVYLRLGANAAERCSRYSELVALSDEDLAAIRLYVQGQRALGSGKFQARIEKPVEPESRSRGPGAAAEGKGTLTTLGPVHGH